MIGTTFAGVAPADHIGLTRAFTPALTPDAVVSWLPVASVETLPGERVRLYVQGRTATFPMTSRASRAAVVKRRPVGVSDR